jgi:hypothetical protein
MSETEISKQIINMIKKEFRQIQLDRHHCGLAKGWHGGIIRLGKEGWPDFVGYLPDGRFFELEIKDPEGKTQKDRKAIQTARRLDICNKGGVCLQVSSVEETREKLNEVLK